MWEELRLAMENPSGDEVAWTFHPTRFGVVVCFSGLTHCVHILWSTYTMMFKSGLGISIDSPALKKSSISPS